MKKTREELFEEAKNRYEAIRKSGYRIMRLLLLYAILGTVIFILMKSVLTGILFGGMLLALGFVSIIPTIRVYNPRTQKKRVEKVLQKFREHMAAAQIKFKPIRENLLEAQKFASWLKNPEVMMFGPFEIAVMRIEIDPHDIEEIEKKIQIEEEHIRKFDEAMQEGENHILDLEVRIEYYNQVAEKNIWQYLRSKKWSNKIINLKKK